MSREGASSSYLAMFAHVASRPEPELDLGHAALLIAEPEYPGLDVAYYVSLLDKLGDEARRRCIDGNEVVRRIGRLLYDEVGFEGNETDYYDPRNSFINEVIDRRTGIPVTLAVVYMEIARRAGVAAQGVAFPGHFLVQVPVKGAAVHVDPFTGKALSTQELRQLLGRATGETKDPDAALLEPVPKRQILIRMLNNLRSIYTSRGDQDRLRRTVEQLSVLAPQDDGLRRDLQALGGTIHVPGKRSGRSVN